jgi:transposase
MAKRQRRSYSDEYKRQAVELILSSGRSAKSVSRELGLDGSVLSRWVAERGMVRADGGAVAPTSQARCRRRTRLTSLRVCSGKTNSCGWSATF